MDVGTNLVSSIDSLESLMSDFINTLMNERKCLLSSNAEQLTPLVIKKNSLIQRINSVDPIILVRISNPVSSDNEIKKIRKIKSILSDCLELNKENGVLVAQNLKMTKNTLNLLTQGTHQEQFELYDNQGYSATTPGKRDHGVA